MNENIPQSVKDAFDSPRRSGAAQALHNIEVGEIREVERCLQNGLRLVAAYKGIKVVQRTVGGRLFIKRVE